METFEYMFAVWPAFDDGSASVNNLNALGAEGWEAVGIAPRAATVPMPGMGASSTPEMVILLKHRIAEPAPRARPLMAEMDPRDRG